MRVVRYLSIAALLVVACGKEPERRVPEVVPVVPPASGAVSVSKPIERAPNDFGPAVFHPQTCAKPTTPPPKSPHEGCLDCKKDEHCYVEHVRGRAFGRCVKSTCEKDADCKGALCQCGPPNRCVAGDCRSAEDCGGRECAPDRWRYGHGSGTFCRTKDDSCKTHDDCGAEQECAFTGGKWACRPTTPAPPPG